MQVQTWECRILRDLPGRDLLLSGDSSPGDLNMSCLRLDSWKCTGIVVCSSDYKKPLTDVPAALPEVLAGV